MNCFGSGQVLLGMLGNGGVVKCLYSIFNAENSNLEASSSAENRNWAKSSRYEHVENPTLS